MNKSIIRASYCAPVCEVENYVEEGVIMTSVLDWANDNDPLIF